MRPLGPMFGDTLIGLLPGTADSTRRFLGRLRDGYTADTLNILLFGDNRPGFRTTRLAPQWYAIRGMFSPSPMKILRGVAAIPVGLVRGLWPDLALLRDIPDRLRHTPTWGREREAAGAAWVLADVPLLFETGRQDEFDAVVVTACAPERQRARLRSPRQRTALPSPAASPRAQVQSRRAATRH